ncbi:MAG: hypothetical protein WHS64_05880 [Fervidobacterium sp.]|uniref:Uncharacterized protein n=1 Tax=Fervidobacterium gondwanense DSM 13020 TaxID=1121883 RepID=A0A1M7SEK9_FERGO|nr:hypothetical protein [Fervidobacterium gondwanense]UXF01168.1 hypothetical protein IB67_06345 [Fervidobacterium riparium]SHN56874.1 hypothetical protein SAMN02745226_00826 [Fervidobacterium gondwanense DSM 13020]
MGKVKVFVLISILFVAVYGFSDFYLNVGTLQIGNENYMVYEFGPEFTVGPLTLGITLTTYATDLTTGNFYFGYPGAQQPSTNIVDGINITALGLDLGSFWFRYGRMRPITYGMGFVFNGYVVPDIRVLDLGVRFGETNLSVHIPYQIAQLSNFTTLQSDSLYTGMLSSKLLMFDLSVFGGVEIGSESPSATPLQYAAGVSLTKEIFGISLGAEADIQYWKDGTIGYGAFAGAYGNFGVLQLVAGPYMTTDGFSPWLIGRNYRTLRLSNDFGPETYKAELGYIVSLGFTLSPYGKASASLKGNFEGKMTLSGEGVVNIPAIGGTNGLVLYGYLYDETPFEDGQFFDPNTQARLTIAYPVFGSFYAGVKYIWENQEWKQTAFVGGSANF